jgi:hypothetical protein
VATEAGSKDDANRFRGGPYSFVFFSSDGGEPLHIHVKCDRQIAKFWLQPVALARDCGFAGHELNKIARLVARHERTLSEAWHEYFGA